MGWEIWDKMYKKDRSSGAVEAALAPLVSLEVFAFFVTFEEDVKDGH